MTTPADWKHIVPQLKDKESIAFVKRIVQFQKDWLDVMVGHLDQALKQLSEMEKKLG
jgi:hypothetical protein